MGNMEFPSDYTMMKYMKMCDMCRHVSNIAKRPTGEEQIGMFLWDWFTSALGYLGLWKKSGKLLFLGEARSLLYYVPLICFFQG